MASPTFWSKILNHWVSFPSCPVILTSMCFPKSGCFLFIICMCAFCLKCFFPLPGNPYYSWKILFKGFLLWEAFHSLPALALCRVLYFTGCIKMTALSSSPGGCKISGHRDYSLFHSVFLMPDTSESNKVLEWWAEQLEKACYCINLIDKIHPELEWPWPATAWSRA